MGRGRVNSPELLLERRPTRTLTTTSATASRRKNEFFLQRDPRSLEEAMEVTAEWLECYNKERPHLTPLGPQRLRYKIKAKNGLTSEVSDDITKIHA